MPANYVKVLATNLYEIAAQQYKDTTAFVQLMQMNNLNDVFVNAPVHLALLAGASAGSYVLTLPPTDDVQVGWAVASDQILHDTIVTRVIHNYADQRLPFCNCDSNRVLPQMGKWVSTTVYVSPSLVNDVTNGDRVAFINSVPTKIYLPPQPNISVNGKIQ